MSRAGPSEQLEVRTDRQSWRRSRRSRSCSCHGIWASHVRGAGLESIKLYHQALPSRLRTPDTQHPRACGRCEPDQSKDNVISSPGHVGLLGCAAIPGHLACMGRHEPSDP